MPRQHAMGHPGLWQRWIGRCGRPIHHLARPGASVVALRRWAAALLLGLALPGLAWAQHFDVELRTSNGPVVGSRITTDFYGDLGLAGLLPIDAATGYKIFPGYFGDLEGGPLQTDDPGFQAFAGTFLRREEVHFRALGTLQHWNPATGRWGPAAADVTVALFGGIPLDVIIGYTENPAAWQTQYDFRAAGTRFSATGIQGPLTALIDDASTRGAFHAHLDWKISAGSGTPPAGAYLVTLSLWSPTLVNGQPKYLASEPIHIAFERGISAAQMAEAISARVRPPAPARCDAQPLAWQVGGSGCGADAPATASGQTVLLDDGSAPAVGRASFQCSDGQWGSATGASCRPLLACSAQTLDWQAGGLACSGPAASAASGQSVIATDAGLPTLGSARFSCQDGQWSAPADASCAQPPPRDCMAQAQTWTVAVAICQAPLPAGTAGSLANATDITGPALGNARYRCNDGGWVLADPPNCALPRACASETLAWQVDGQSCSATAAAAASGDAVLLDDQTTPTLGSARASCSDGRWSTPTSTRCSVPPPADCGAQVQTWQLNGAACQAALAAAPAGASATATDSIGLATGVARYRCDAGRWQLEALLSCAAPQACAGEVLSWTVGGDTCHALAAAAESGQSVRLDDSSAPTVGSAEAHCNDGRLGLVAGATCAVPPPPDCPAQLLDWTHAGQACQAALPRTASGAVALALDTGAPAVGWARAQCQAGQWQAPFSAQCGAWLRDAPRAQPRAPWQAPSRPPWALP